MRNLVLLIDDEPRMGRLVGMSVEDLETRVVQVDGLSEALEAARQERPDAVLLDLALGDEDGLEIMPHLRSDPALEDVPIVVFSVHDSRREEAFRRGAKAFVSKPFKRADLRGALEPYLA
jgi:two-component system sensor histidine kinase/response regulator